eukprot:81646_1
MSQYSNTLILQEELTSLGIECDSLKREIEIFNNEIEIHKSENTQLKETIDDLRNANNLLKYTNEQLTEQLKAYDQDRVNDLLIELQANNKNLYHDISQQKQNMERVDQINTRLTDEIGQYCTKISRLETGRNEMMENHYRFELEQNILIQQLEDNVEALQSQLNVRSDGNDITDPTILRMATEPLIQRGTLIMNEIPSVRFIDKVRPDFGKRDSPVPASIQAKLKRMHTYQFSNQMFPSLFAAQNTDCGALEIVNDNDETMQNEYETNLSKQREEYEERINGLLKDLKQLKLQNLEFTKQIDHLQKHNKLLQHDKNSFFSCF